VVPLFWIYNQTMSLMLVPHNCSPGRGVIPSLAGRGEQSCQLTSAQVLPVSNMASWSVVRSLHVILWVCWRRDATFETGSTSADVSWQDCFPPAPQERVSPLYRGYSYQALTVLSPLNQSCP
jgi:hypothetical protein